MTNNRKCLPANKLPGLELLRFVAALAVLVYHYKHFAYVADKPVDLLRDQLPFYGLLQPFYLAGNYGVWVFWCISGFIFFWKYRDSIAEQSISGWKFFVFRLSRLYPLHIATLVLVAMLQPLYFHLNGYFFVCQANDLQHFLLQIFMASDWVSQTGNSFNGPIWSISVEVLAYGFFFLSLRFVTRSALLNLIVIVAGMQIGGEVACCFSFFYIGGLAAIARRAVSSSTHKDVVEGIAWSAAIMFAVWGCALASSSYRLSDLAILGYTPILLFCISGEIGVSPAIQRWIEAAGNLTYSSYLLHFPIQLAIGLGFATHGTAIPFYNASFFVIFITATLVASRLTYLYFEAPAQDLIRNRLLGSGLVAFAAAGRTLRRETD
jgi:peptidoglycan/LPS O-acetylase OafA/YrhL